MPPMISLCLLALAVSLDGFGVGAMYGIRKIRISLLSIGIISVFSGVVIYASMQIGMLISGWISPTVASVTGALILIGIGIWAMVQMAMQGQPEEELVPIKGKPNDTMTEHPILQIQLKRLGLVIQILKTPSVADVDHSGSISPQEAALLGIALSLDAFGAGIGAALIGFSPVITSAFIALASGTFIASGLKAGFLFSDVRRIKRFTFLPGCILIIMGIIKLF